MSWIDVNGISLRYRLEGEGRPLLVLIHEAGGCLESYDEAANLLAANFRVLRYDQRGFGFSEKPKRLTFEDAVADLAGLLDALCPRENVHLVGCSFGGDIAVGFALEYPDRVASLMIASPRIGGQSAAARRDNIRRGEALVRKGMRSAMAAQHERSYPEELRRLNRDRFSRYQARWVCNSPQSFMQLVHMVNEIDLSGDFRRIQAPTLVIGCKLDLTREPALAERVAQAIPDGRYLLVATGHFFSVQTPELFATVVSDFIGGLNGSAHSTRKLQGGSIHSAGELLVEDRRIHYQVDGARDGPWLVLSNSLMTDLSIWDGQVEGLRDRFRILRYDQRGHGASGVAAAAPTFEDLALDVVALLDHLAIATCSFVGLSMGVPTGLAFWKLAPSRIERLVLVDGQARTATAGAAAWRERIEFVRGKGMAAFAETVIPRWFASEFVSAGKADKVRQGICATSPEGFVGGATALCSFDFQDVLPAISVPTLLLAGANDGPAPQIMEEMHREIRGSRFAVVPDAGHIPNWEQPALFNKALIDFLVC